MAWGATPHQARGGRDVLDQIDPVIVKSAHEASKLITSESAPNTKSICVDIEALYAISGIDPRIFDPI